MFENPATGVLVMIGVTFGALIIGTITRRVGLRGGAEEAAGKRLASLKTWWVLAVLLTAAILVGHIGATALFMLASGLGMREYVRLPWTDRTDRVALGIAFAVIPVNYLVIILNRYELFLMAVPLGLLLLLSGWKAASGRIQDYVRSTAGLYWGAMVLVYGPSHAPLLYTLPERSNPVAGSAGWLLYLVILTECNDISQALVGRRIGAHKITPRVSPKKSWEGFLAGVVITMVLAVALAPVLTPLSNGQALPDDNGPAMARPYLWPALAGVLIAISGFLGDINMSAIKRDAGVKNAGTMLAGQGGVIDRIDSLTFSAPVFYYFVRWWSGG